MCSGWLPWRGSRKIANALIGIIEMADTHPHLVREARQEICEAISGSVKDPDPAIRARSINLLSLLRDPAAPSIVVAALCDSDSRVRVAGLMAAFHLRPPGCLDDVIRLLADDDPHVRPLAAAALERVGDPSSIGVLQEVRSRERDEGVGRQMDDVIDILEGRRPPTPIVSFMEDPQA